MSLINRYNGLQLGKWQSSLTNSDLLATKTSTNIIIAYQVGCVM